MDVVRLIEKELGKTAQYNRLGMQLGDVKKPVQISAIQQKN